MNLPWRLAYLEREDNVVFSTIKAPCLAWYGEYETAISIDGNPWRVCKGYDSEEEALKGHEEFVKMTKEEILKLESLDILGGKVNDN